MNWRGFLRSQFQSGQSRNNRRLAARQRSSSQNLEVLEQRTLLAGDVAAKLLGQTAFLTGDSDANNIQITVQDGNVVVVGLDNTTVNGSSEAFILAQDSVAFSGSIITRMAGGDDEFELSEASVGGLLHVYGGTGNDTLVVSNSAQVGKGLMLNGQSGTNSLAVSETTVGRSVWMVNGAGNDLMTIADSTVGGSFVGIGGRGNDDLVIDNTTIGRDVWMSLGSGNDDVAMLDSTVTRRFVVYGGRGSDFVFAEDSNVGRGTRLILGNHQDRVSIQGDSQFSGRTVVAGGRKSDVVEVAASATVSKLRAYSISGGTVEADALEERITGPNGAIAAAAALTQTTSNLQLSLSNNVVSESAGNGASVLTISRDSSTTEALEVTIQSSLTTRLQPEESVVTIPAGATSVSVNLNVIDDTTANGQAVVTLTASATGTESQTTTITVNDDESSELSLTAAATRITEDSDTGAETVFVTARRTGDTTSAETIDLAYELDDGSLASSVLTGPATAEFAAGSDSVTFTVTTVPNTTAADDVAVMIVASNGTNTAEASLLVEDNDKDRLTVRFETLSVVEDGPPATVTISRTSDTTEALNVTLESSDPSRIAFNDQSILALVIPAGATSVTQNVSAIENDVFEGNLTVTLTATAPGLDAGANTLEVIDNDSLALDLQVSGSTTIAEEAGTDAATVTLSRNSADVSAALEVTLAATGDDRLSSPTTVTIPAGQASVEFTIDAIDNDRVDTPETGTVIFTASATDYPDQTLELTVTNDDVATTTFDPTSIVVSEGQGTAQVTLQRNNSAGTETVALTYSDTSLVSGPTSVEFADGESTLTFNTTVIDNDSFENNPTVTISGNVTGQPEIVLNVDVANDEILAVTTDLSSNTIEQTVGGIVTKEVTLTVTGQTEAGATVAIDSDADGEFDDGTTTADSNGNYSVDVTLTHNVTNNGANRIQAQATLAAAPSPATSESTNVHLAIGTIVRFETNQDLDNDGSNDFYDIELLDDDAPNTVDNFLQYMDDGAYENNIVHRSPPSFVIQGGGFRVDGQTVTRITTRPAIDDEFIEENSNLRGTLSMAHAGPNTGTSQWFVNVGNNTNLDNVPHTVFGRVIGNGMTVVDQINSLDTYPINLTVGQSALSQTPLVNAPYQTLTGTVSTQDNSFLLTGSGTQFTTELQVGDVIVVNADSQQPLRVVSIQSDTELTVDLESSQTATDRLLFIQNLPANEDYIIFSNIGEILDSI